jgi:catechol 2,3-dioxygenase-like lactoylglutathione lyase family enzyme
MINARRFSHVTLETPDLESQIAYFTEILGLVVAERDNGRAYLATKHGDLVVTLATGGQARCARLAFQVARETDFAEIKKGIEAEGLRGQSQNDSAPGIPQTLSFEDPKGTVCELFAAQTPICKPQPVAGVGPIKLGHLAFVVPEPKEYADFYSRVLGFRVSDWIEDWFVFMRCGPDHHTVNFVRGKHTKMHHVAFELKDWPQVQSACDFLGGKKIPIIWGPGRHGPGHNIYTYHRNPEDQIIEMFTELDKMLDENLGYFEPRPWHRDHPQVPKVWGPLPTDIWGAPAPAEYARQRD